VRRAADRRAGEAVMASHGIVMNAALPTYQAC
jgi:hypothetical protein